MLSLLQSDVLSCYIPETCQCKKNVIDNKSDDEPGGLLMKITCFLNRNPWEANILPSFNIAYFAKITEKNVSISTKQ